MVSAENSYIGNSSKIDGYLSVLAQLPSGTVVNKSGDASSDRAFGFEQNSSKRLLSKLKTRETLQYLLVRLVQKDLLT